MQLGSYAAGDAVVFDGSKMELSGQDLLILKDQYDSLSPDQAYLSSEYAAGEQKVPNLGVSSYSYWVKFTIINKSDNPDFLLEFQQPTIEVANLYKIENQQIQLISKSGKSFPFDQRHYHHPNYLYKLKIPTGEAETFLMKVKSGDQIMLPLNIGPTDQVLRGIRKKDMFFGMYFGIIMVMIFYNLFLYLSVRDKPYIFYVFNTLFIGLIQAALLGYTFQYLWPENPWLAIYDVYLILPLGGIAAMLFLMVFLRTKEYTPVLHKGFYIFILFYAVTIILSLINKNLGFVLIQMIGLVLSIYMLLTAYLVYRKGNRSAKFYLLAWSVFLVGLCTIILRDFGVLPHNLLTRYMMPTGSALEVILLSFALADRIHILKKEKEEAQVRELETAQEKQQLIRQQNVILEQKVRERTAELRETNEKLNVALQEREEAQAQLVHNEKMASVGQLTAGIAHEINNPVNFITGGITPLRNNLTDIITYLNKQEEMMNDLSPAKIKELQKLKDELEIDYLRGEIEDMLNAIEEGATRTSVIVKGLRTFSRLDENDRKRVNIREGIDSTLTLLRNEIRDDIEIIRKYEEIPEIDCYPGQLNQVFMNILTNAVQAIRQKSSDEKGRISINLKQAGEEIEIRIEDNGIGIPEDIKQKIFEPFFTTKEVGKGTGLGLSISHSIVKNHGGNLDVTSYQGKGTEILITLPLNFQ